MRGILTAIFLLSSLAWAQLGGSSLEGTVHDSTKAVIPGSLVVLKDATDNRRSWSVKTDGQGRFQLAGVPRGTYLLNVTREGFRATELTLLVGDRKLQPLVVILTVAVVNEQMEVNESAGRTDSAANKDAVSVDQNALENLPVFDQDYIGTMSMFLDLSAVATGGVSLVVDGMESSRVGLSPSTVQQVKINDDPYAAEFFRPGRGRIEVITKPAAPEYHGTFNFTFRDYHLNASNRFARVNPPEQRRIFEGSLTGPLGTSGKNSFLVSANRQEEDLQAVVFAQTLSGLVSTNVATPRRNLEVAGRFTHAFSDAHTLSLQYSFQQDSGLNQGVGGVVLDTAGADQSSREQQYRLFDTLIISPNLLSQFQIRLETNYDTTASSDPGQKIVVLDSFTGGGAQSVRFRTEKDIQLNWIMTWTKKKHTLKAGVNIPNISRRLLLDSSNFGGTFYFSDLQSYAANLPYSFTTQRGNGRVVYKQDEIGGFIQDEIKLRPNLSLNAGLRYDWQNAFRDSNNFAPRFSLAYAPQKLSKAVIRAGAGLFYDRTGASPVADISRYDGQHLNSYTITNPSYPNPFVTAPPLSSDPVNTVVLAPDVVIPYTAQYGVSVERQVNKATFSVGYRGSRGVKLFRSRDINAPREPLYVARPNPALGTVRQIESTGTQKSNALEISVKGKINRFVSGLAQYTFGKTLNDTSGISFFPANSYDLSGEWGRADFDQRHRLNLLEVINAGKFFNLGIGLSLASGKPYTITTGLDANRDGLANERPFGTTRNSAPGPGYANLDLRWSRDFKLVASRKEKSPVATIAFDAFNALNRTNYVTFLGNQRSPFFGQPVAELPTRRLQMTARFKF